MTSILFVVTAADKWTLADGTERETGFWAEELIAPHRVFSTAGWDITFATPGGKAPVVDEMSLDVLPEQVQMAQENYLAEIGVALEDPLDLAEVNPDDYDAVFYPGGHGPMEDLSSDAESARIIRAFLDNGRPLGLVCHAPAALLATAEGDNWPFKGWEMTGFSDTEEGDSVDVAKWTLESRLRELGAKYEAADPLQPNVVVDRNLYTGQNPASSEPLAQKMMRDLRS
ncbi:Putative intracellular protease/amidase [Corynebacterium camporealensis]|uniref:Putative intracellular protease/amidase n=1 Tax=Corynebacterium camporealensis TaxID=161896 RepID=A0A0F6QX51_9CORY|nr:type 1 glutamine amidotransferase domain-containing protein [Corynebacterium camporealensis]AKE38458.1 putative intracellular protease/amidase [Corynebacterium camporealensis]AVH87758.1 Putative intracellular protease/amidase [Corynebacterium camporealensis]MDY5840494.1 type 1 glutamine amidotransferase domain-containing protein [Corynebacterium camporealensis]